MWARVIWVFLAAVVLALAAALLLGTLLRVSYGQEVLQYFDGQFLARASQYQDTTVVLFLARQAVTWAFLLWLAVGGWKYIAQVWRPSLPAMAAYLAVIILLLYLLTFPLDYYRGFVLEHRFGLSAHSFPSWLADYAKSALLGMAVALFAFSGLYALMLHYPARWWYMAGAAAVLFMFLVTYLYPVIVDPLFYRFEPLTDEEMTGEIVRMADEAGIEVQEVLVADAGRRTHKANAYFTGLGQTRRIVVFDTLLTGFSRDEALAVIAHEMAHWKFSHVFKGILLGAAGTFLGLFLLKTALAGMGIEAGMRAVALAFLFFSLFSFASLPIQNAVSRSFERQADREAVHLTGRPHAHVTLKRNLALTNLSAVQPHPFVKLVLYTHPPIMERIELLLEEKEKIRR